MHAVYTSWEVIWEGRTTFQGVGKRQNNGTLVTQKKEGNRSKEGRRPDGNRVYMCERLWAQDSGRWATKTGVWGQSGKQRKTVSKKHKQTKCKIKCKYAVSQLLPLRNIFIYEMQRIINLQHFFSNTVTIFQKIITFTHFYFYQRKKTIYIAFPSATILMQSTQHKN